MANMYEKSVKSCRGPFSAPSLSSLTTGNRDVRPAKFVQIGGFEYWRKGSLHNLKNKLSSKNYRSRKRLNKVDVVASLV